MDLGWKVMIPIALGWFMLLSLLRIGGDRGWTRLHKTTVGVISLLVLAVAGGLLMLASRVSARNREREGAMF
jgi:NADH-quinone oxidoreductase subunit H